MNRSFSVGMPTLQTAVLKWEAFPDFCRESLPLLAGAGATRIVEIGTILALVSATAVQAAAAAGNTGNGAMTLSDPAVGVGVVPGIYQAICIEPATDAGTFEVFDPAGVSIGTATVGVEFDGPVKFTIADGATDFAAGDAFTITVPEGDTAVEWDPDAEDASSIAAAVAISRGTAPDGVAGTILALARGPAIVSVDGIAWPDGVTADQKAAALAALKARGIIGRYT